MYLVKNRRFYDRLWDYWWDVYPGKLPGVIVAPLTNAMARLGLL